MHGRHSQSLLLSFFDSPLVIIYVVFELIEAGMEAVKEGVIE